MSSEGAGLTNHAVLRKVKLSGRIELRNIVRSSRYFLGSAACFVAIWLHFQSLGFFAFFIGLFGLILLERSIYVVMGLQTR